MCACSQFLPSRGLVRFIPSCLLVFWLQLLNFSVKFIFLYPHIKYFNARTIYLLYMLYLSNSIHAQGFSYSLYVLTPKFTISVSTSLFASDQTPSFFLLDISTHLPQSHPLRKNKLAKEKKNQQIRRHK